jgi:two-component system chemotaxis sensor kinase CheA
MEALAHAGESLLVRLRDGSLPLSAPIASALLSMVDCVRASLRSIESAGRESEAENTDLIERFRVLRDEGAGAEPVAGPQIPLAPAREIEVGVPPAVNACSAAEADSSQPTPEQSTGSVADTNVRVDVSLLEELMNLVGELVLARNQILQFGAKLENHAFVSASQRLNLITTELQERVMQTRMQPIGSVWSRLPRVVRDLAVTCGKQVRVEMQGKDTELDRTILEAIKDPLTHIVRNAVDHGIESPAVRVQSGKARTGTLTMRAYHESGQVNIEIGDDGAGLNVAAIREKAVDRGLASAEQLEAMSEHELMQMVFLPGFSTAKAVTNVSGRGVGMDVVKTNIERIGGIVELTSKAGLGTTLRIRIPLTLAIVPALIVVSNGQRFAIPQTNLLELVRLEGKSARIGIESVHGTPVHRLRGKLLPLALLSHVLSGASALRHGDAAWSELAQADAILNIVVLQTGAGQLGLVVDDVRDTEEIVVKPLGPELRGIPLFAGATIMGDGRVALILDVAGLAQHVSASTRSRAESHRTAAGSHVSNEANAPGAEALLLFNTGSSDVTAVPVSQVTRIEEFPRERLERTGQSVVIQYRGEILSLIELGSAADIDASPDTTNVTVLVFSERERSIGLVIHKILDVVEEPITVDRATSRPGVLGTVIVQGRVTDLIDVKGVIGARAPWFYEDAAA